MLSARHSIAALTAVVAAIGLSATAEATYRGCGFDRYGYHPPNFRGCAPAVEVVVVRPPVVVVKRVRRVRVKPVHRVVHRAPRVRAVVAVLPPPPPPPIDNYYAVAPIQPGCYFDNGYDMRVHRICYSGW